MQRKKLHNNKLKEFLFAHKIFFDVLEEELEKTDLDSETKDIIRICSVYGVATNLSLKLNSPMGNRQ